MRDLVRVLDMAWWLTTVLHDLFGGRRQQVVIARVLDATVQVLALLRALQQELGMGMVVVTRDLGVATEIADQVAVTYAGEIIEQGPARDVLRHHARAKIKAK